MSAAIEAITPILPLAAVEVRREFRSEKIRIVEYAVFPRETPNQQLRVGFSRDLSNSGMCLGVDRHESVGSLLRLCMRDIEGRSRNACIGRVIWTSLERDGRHWLGIELVKPSEPDATATAPGRQ